MDIHGHGPPAMIVVRFSKEIIRNCSIVLEQHMRPPMAPSPSDPDPVCERMKRGSDRHLDHVQNCRRETCSSEGDFQLRPGPGLGMVRYQGGQLVFFPSLFSSSCHSASGLGVGGAIRYTGIAVFPWHGEISWQAKDDHQRG